MVFMNDLSDIDALILCGGLGKRLRSVDDQIPKVMMPVKGVPFLDHIIDYVKGQGITRVVLCTGYKARMIEDHYRDLNGEMVIDFSRELEPLGTGGAVRNAQELVVSDSFIVFNGDSLCSVDLKDLFQAHQTFGATATLTVSKVSEGKDYGGIVLGANNQITAFNEKSEDVISFANAGVYCFKQSIFSLMPPQENFSLEYDVFPSLVSQGLYGFQTEKSFQDIGTPERYKQAQ